MSRRCRRRATDPGRSRPRRLASLSVVCLLLLAACGAGGTTQSVDADQVIQLGAQLFQSEGCVHCHGDMGQGVTAPALRDGNVIRTFPVCADQIRWVTLGSARWRRDVGPTYGAQSKPVSGDMPGFGNRLTATQLESVVAFTRVEFGGLDPVKVVADCSR